MSHIENEVCRKIQTRASFGMEKYGTNLERSDLTTKQWLIHAQEEAMDLANYLEVLIQQEEGMEKFSPGSVHTLTGAEEIYLHDRKATIRSATLMERVKGFFKDSVRKHE